MKAFLLAGGDGMRLRPITDSIPKCLVPIRQQPLLEIWLDLCRVSGIDEVLINLHSHADTVRQFIVQRDYGLDIKLFEEPQLLGSAGTIAANRKWVESEPCFWVFYADVLTNMDLEMMLSFHRNSDVAATLGLYKVANPAQCGIVQVDDANRIRSFTEKPKEPAGNLAFSGVMIGTAELLEAIPPTVPADLGFHVFPRLVGRMAGYVCEEYVKDVGTLASYETAQHTWPGPRLEDSHA
jgi:mannose-1-phosphate guanylyltransferase